MHFEFEEEAPTGAEDKFQSYLQVQLFITSLDMVMLIFDL
jgi:hypothetical protein